MQVKASIRQVFDWSRVDLGTHYALIVNGKIVSRAVGPVTMKELQSDYAKLRKLAH